MKQLLQPAGRERPRRALFSRMEYETTNVWEAMCCCTSTKLVLEGEEVKRTELYTDKLVKAIHSAWKQSVKVRRENPVDMTDLYQD